MKASTDLAFFVTVATQLNLTNAARELGVTPPAVSKRLQELEKRLGVRLMQRTTRRVTLTEEGELYFQEALRLIAEIETVEARLSARKAQPRGRLRIHATYGFGRAYIAPAVAAFLREYPDVQIQLDLTDKPINLVESGHDLGIYVGAPPDARLIARRLAANRRFVCASPRYLEHAGRPRTPNDLAQHTCLVLRQDRDAFALWRFTSKRGQGALTVKVRGTFTSNDGECIHKLALEGHGIMLRSEWDVAQSLRDGKLDRVLVDYEAQPADIYAVYPARDSLPAKTSRFIEFLTTRLGPVPPWRGKGSAVA